MTVERADSPGETSPSRRADACLGRRSKIAAAVVGFGLVALIVLWLERKPIAREVIDRALAARGVPVRYAIRNLGLGRQRLVDVVIGDPAHPDAVADWVELTTSVGLSGPAATGMRVGRVRLRGRLVDGKLSLGAIDKLLPASAGGPFTLPSLWVDVADARMRLETPQGLVGLKLVGSGRLDDGFSGKLAAVSDRLTSGGCVAQRVAAVVGIRIAGARPMLSGPVRVARLACGQSRLMGATATLDATLDAALDRWTGRAALSAVSVTADVGRMADLLGTISFNGSARGTMGRIDLRSGAFGSAAVAGAGLALAGSYQIGAAVEFVGTLDAERAVVAPDRLARLAGLAAGTPVGPLVDKAGEALRRAGGLLSGRATLSVAVQGRHETVQLTRADLSTASGAHLTFSGDGLRYEWPSAATRIDGRLTIGGGGMPEGTIELAQRSSGAPLAGRATFLPYAAPGAVLSLTPVLFTAAARNTVFSTRVTLSGPLGDGRIERASLPVAVQWDGRRQLVINPGCAALTIDRVAISGLVLGPNSLRLCPVDGALLRLDGLRVAGGVRLEATHLAGRLGDTPVSLALAGGRVGLADRRFAASAVAVRIGTAERMTSLDFGAVEGGPRGKGLAGTFARGGGQIANVPLVMSAAAGNWSVAGERLALVGEMAVADTAAESRFAPLAAREVKLALLGGAISVTGTLATPVAGVKVADVAIAHDLRRGTGHADLSVPGITFAKAFQPDVLTKLTYGVIADVAGTVAGRGRIDWSPQGVTSNGAFRTDKIDLAAAFGPVTGVQGEVRFTDLLGMVTAPGQVATVATLNPGIAVENGTIRYRLLPGARIQVEGGDWPFAGGQLVLDPTTLDFAEAAQRHLTFRVTGLDAQQFLQQFDFKNLDATGRFDGVLPMVFDQQGGRIDGGHLAVREGGGTIAYVGQVSQEDVGLWGNLAFQALKALRYRNVEILMNGPLAGEMVTEVRFAGVSQGQGTKSNFLIRRLAKLPFVFNIRIQAPFRGLIDSARSFYDPSLLIQRNLPALLRERERVQKPPIQPPESEKLP